MPKRFNLRQEEGLGERRRPVPMPGADTPIARFVENGIVKENFAFGPDEPLPQQAVQRHCQRQNDRRCR